MKDVAEELVKRDWSICVVATQHHSELATTDIINGVSIRRSKVLRNIGKGAISPNYFRLVSHEARNSAILNIHAPMLEAGAVALINRGPTVLTYHCDVSVDGKYFKSFQNRIIDASTRIAIKNSDFITISSIDYADHSRISRSLKSNRIVIPPSCKLREKGVPTYRESSAIHIGFLGRIVEEKGLTYLVEGFRAIRDPNARLLIAGDFESIPGGSDIEPIKHAIGDDSRIRLLGHIPESEIADFYASIDVFVFPSINSFEAFGIAQVEAIMLGIPVIASNLPGVREPVKQTGLGLLVEPRSASDITEKLQKIFEVDLDRAYALEIAKRDYEARHIADSYEEMFLRTILERE